MKKVERNMSDKQKWDKESGNVLFLILIAVALFAALSYAVTQSSRGGGAGSSSEAALIASAQLTQYPASLRTSVLRMMVGGTDVSELLFNAPSDFAALDTATLRARAVFHPHGGGATYMGTTPDLIAGVEAERGYWFFNNNLAIQNIGLDDEELTAFLPGVSLGVCRSLNRSVGVGGSDGSPPLVTMPRAVYTETIMHDASTIDAYANNISFLDTPANAFEIDGSVAAGGGTLIGQPFACFRNTTPDPDEYVYYHVLVER